MTTPFVEKNRMSFVTIANSRQFYRSDIRTKVNHRQKRNERTTNERRAEETRSNNQQHTRKQRL